MLSHPLRRYFCIRCGATAQGAVVPAGWLSLTRHVGDLHEPNHRLGLFCSAKCLLGRAKELVEKEESHDWRAVK